MYNWRRLNSYQLVVKRDNLPPVGLTDRFRLRMNGRNRSLQCVRAEAAGLQGFLQQCHSLRDLLFVPERAVLIFQQNQLSGRRGSRGVTGFLQQHQGKQPNDLRLWLEVGQQPAQSNRLAGELGPRYLRSRRSRITFVKDEIDDLKHRAQSLRQFLRRRHLVRNRCLSNLCLCAHNALRQRTRSDEEGLGYLLGGQPAHLTQGERNVRFRRQRWMTAGKNQAQPIILKAVVFLRAFRRTRLRFEISHELVLRRIKSCPSTQSINGFESGRRNQPWSRVAGYSTARPQAQRSRKGFVHRLLGKIKITKQADQSCKNSSRIHAIKGVEQFAYLLRGALGHDDDLSKPATPNQFGKRRIDAKCPGRDSEIGTTERFLC